MAVNSTGQPASWKTDGHLLPMHMRLTCLHFPKSMDMRVKTERKTARLTLLLDPRKKALFEEICAAQDLTPSQVVRQLIREYIIENAGQRALPSWLLAASRKPARR